MTNGIISSAMRTKAAKIASLIDEYRVVINKGSNTGVKIGDIFQIYKVGQEVVDPDTKVSLGRVEIIKGKGEVIHVQETMAILQTTEKHEVQRRPTGALAIFAAGIEVTKEPRAFINPEIGDHARLVS